MFPQRAQTCRVMRWIRRGQACWPIFTRQDAAILNIQRACEAALDMGQHLIRREKLGVPESARDVFALLAQGGWLDATLADGLKRMVGFRNIAVHNDQSLQLAITVSIIENTWTSLCTTARRCCCAMRKTDRCLLSPA